MKPPKMGETKNRSLNSHMMTLHQRLRQALDLGVMCQDNKGRRWECTNVEVQGHVVRSIASFLECISSDLLRHQLVKNSIVDMVLALEKILQSGNEMVLNIAASVTVKLIELLGNSVLQYDVSNLVGTLSCLLSSQRSSISVSSAIALNCILSKMTLSNLGRHHKIWQAIEEGDAVGNILHAVQGYINGSQPIECFKEMLTLLRTIMWQWPPSRYFVWSNAVIMSPLQALCKNLESSVVAKVLRLYSALALCSNGAKKLLEGGALVKLMVHFMGDSQPHHVRVEAFILMQHLSRSEEGCSKMIELCCEPIVQCILNAMSGWKSHFHVKVPNDQIPLVVEACRSALITRWAGKHHSHFWRERIDQALLGLIFRKPIEFDHSQAQLPLQELAVVEDDLGTKGLRVVRPYVWDILGWLAAYCPPDFNPKIYGDKCCLDMLIACACTVAAKTFQTVTLSSHKDLHVSGREPICRAVLLMVHSPCKYIASRVRKLLLEALTPFSEKHLQHQLYNLKSIVSRNDIMPSDSSQIVIILISLTSHISLFRYQNLLSKSEVMEALIALIRKCLSSDWQVTRSSIAPHLQNATGTRICCWVLVEEWVGGDLILFFCLWALFELMGTFYENSHQEVNFSQASSGIELESKEDENLLYMLHKINSTGFSPGVRWFSACCLSFFGLYGFPCCLGERIKKALYENELADVDLILSNGHHLRVHKVILMVTCPSLLPPEVQKSCEKMLEDDSAEQCDIEQPSRSIRQEVRLSSHVSHGALVKLLEFVYMGCTQADDNIGKQLKSLSKRCNMMYLSDLLYRKTPKWGTQIPSLDFTLALRTYGHLSDTILEANPAEVMSQNCTICFLSSPHMHVHRILLWSSCTYLAALFQSGMQDSKSQIVKVPVGWKALCKLVSWFYTGELPKPSLDCLWKHLDTQDQLLEIQAYVELAWLSQFWLLEDVHEESYNVVLSCLKTSHQLALLVTKSAADLTQWEIVEAAVNYIAPLYPQMRDTGELEAIDEELRDLVRATYVRLSQEGHL
ncbi:BTB/POZ domain-containing protein At1g04390 [Aristolochia californica]|uniref:BTB/POZ domain-containing protein At1g04390 n=1 Tax=Aristolochia californica TaxID=171875 RepID=UPI0035DB07C3